MPELLEQSQCCSFTSIVCAPIARCTLRAIRLSTELVERLRQKRFMIRHDRTYSDPGAVYILWLSLLSHKKEADWRVAQYAREHVPFLLSLPFKDAAID